MSDKVKPKRLSYAQAEYKPEYCDKLISMFEKGDSRAHFCSDLNLSYDVYDAWYYKYPEFRIADGKAKPKCEKYWINLGRENMRTNKEDGIVFNHIIYSMNMRNRFGWSEHRKVKIEGLDTAKTFSDKFNILIEHISNGKLAANEVHPLTALLASGMKIAESIEMQERISKLEEILKERENNVPNIEATATRD